PWVPTSPHIPAAASPKYYVCSGILGELGVISEGIGYTLPFQLFAATWIHAGDLATRMNALNLDGVLFRPITFKPFYGKLKDSTLHGVQIHVTDYVKLNLMSLQFLFLQTHHELYPEKNPFSAAVVSRLKAFDKVAGTDEVRKRFSSRMKYEDVKEYLEKDTESFKKESRKYWVYQ
ncbi:MAG: DUF1343 domain-containing protein, partial [Bacteroidota bacterium]